MQQVFVKQMIFTAAWSHDQLKYEQIASYSDGHTTKRLKNHLNTYKIAYENQTSRFWTAGTYKTKHKNVQYSVKSRFRMLGY